MPKKADTFVTKEEFKVVEGAVNKILDLLEKKADVPETKEEKAVNQAVPNKFTANPEWEAVASEILGDYLDHTEVEHEKTGGIKFTVVIKNEYSNASKEYLDTVKVDRRTKEVGALGLDGVTEWCKLIKANLSRPK